MRKIINKLRDFIEYAAVETNIFRTRIADKKKYNILKNANDNLSFPKFENPKVSIIIPVYNNYQYTINCLYSILNTVKGIDYEVIIADDCSIDKTSGIKTKIENINYVKTQSNSGFLLNCNNAFKYAKGEYIWLLNNDTQVVEGALFWLLKTFEQKSDAGAVGSKLILPNKLLQEAGGIIYNNAVGCNFGRFKSPFDKGVNYLKEVDYCSGASLLFKKDLIMELGGFDEKFTPAYFEDTDLCFRIREKGLKVYYQPKSEVIHFESVSMSEKHNELMEINQKKFLNKWKKVLEKQAKAGEGNFLAKDRSLDKKTLLFCDDGILKPDMNCGNRSSFQYLELFNKSGFNVKYLGKGYIYNSLPKYEENIQQIGVEMLDSNPMKLAYWLRKNGKHVDYIFINRPGVWKYYINLFNKYCSGAKKYIKDMIFIF